MRRLLLIENAERRTLKARFFREQGWDVQTVPSGEEALAHLDGGILFDLIILDLHLPGMDGITALAALRRRTAVPVLALSRRTGSGVDLRPAAEALGADRALWQPLPTQDLFEHANWLLTGAVNEAPRPQRFTSDLARTADG